MKEVKKVGWLRDSCKFKDGEDDRILDLAIFECSQVYLSLYMYTYIDLVTFECKPNLDPITSPTIGSIQFMDLKNGKTEGLVALGSI